MHEQEHHYYNLIKDDNFIDNFESVRHLTDYLTFTTC